MVKPNETPTVEKAETSSSGLSPVSRRRMLQLSGVGLVVGTVGAVGASAENDELPNSILLEQQDEHTDTPYEFLTSGSVALDSTAESNGDSGRINGGHVAGTLTGTAHAYRFSGTLSYLEIDGEATVTLGYGDSGSSSSDRLEIVATAEGSVDYEITSDDRVMKVLDVGDRSANPGEDSVTEQDDGSWLVAGSTENGLGDTYDFTGDIERFDPVEGDFTLFFNGEQTTVTELTGQTVPEEEPTEEEEETVDREHWYRIEATGDEFVDYYFEVEDGGDLIPATINDSVVDDEFHWRNEDGTKAAGRIFPGDAHAYAFDSLIADVTIEGDAHATVNGVDSNLDYYPQASATGDHWKGHFPWHLDGEERTHWYRIEATGDEFVDYYFEVQDGGDLIPSLVEDSSIDYEYFWIGDEGTKAAGRIFPGDAHAYAFDSLVADVTIEGDAHATVNGVDSNLDYYPQDSATGNHWKTGFPWQDDDHEAPGEDDGDVGIRHSLYDGPVGGGSGMPSSAIRSKSDADFVVTNGNLGRAVSRASAGDVIYVEGSASASEINQRGVTIVGNRGAGNDGRINNANVTARNVTFDGLVVNMSGGITVSAPGFEATNTEFYNGGSINFTHREPRATFEQCLFHDISGPTIQTGGYQSGSDVTACGSSWNLTEADNRIRFIYCEWYDLGRHGIAGTTGYFEIIDNHIHGRISANNDHFLELRAPNACRDGGVNRCGSPCGTGIVEHNLIEMRNGDGNATRLAAVRGTPAADTAYFRYNEAPGNRPAVAGCEASGQWNTTWGEQIVLQNAGGRGWGTLDNVVVESNQL